MKKRTWIRLSLIVFLLCCLSAFFRQLCRNKEIVRNRFLEIKDAINFSYLQLQIDGDIAELLVTRIDALSPERMPLIVLSPYGLLCSSPDFDTILWTGIYYEGDESYGFYNSETLMDSIQKIAYTYSVSSVQRRGRNQYDVCIKGAVSYRGNMGEEDFIRWPFRIDYCYPFTLRKGNLVFNLEVFSEREAF